MTQKSEFLIYLALEYWKSRNATFCVKDLLQRWLRISGTTTYNRNVAATSLNEGQITVWISIYTMTKVAVRKRIEKNLKKWQCLSFRREFYVTFDAIEFIAMVPEVLMDDPMRWRLRIVCGGSYVCLCVPQMYEVDGVGLPLLLPAVEFWCLTTTQWALRECDSSRGIPNWKSDVWLTVHRNSLWIRKTN